MGSTEHGKLFVGGLHWNTTSEGLRAYFERFGAVTESTVMRDAVGKSRCFGFVTMAEPSAVDVVLSQRHILDSKQIDPKPATLNPPPPTPRAHFSGKVTAPVANAHPGYGFGQTSYQPAYQPSGGRDEYRVFVGGLPLEAGEDEIRAALLVFGDVQTVSLLRDRETGHSRGYAFVAFASRDSAHSACSSPTVTICERAVEIRPAHPKSRVSHSPHQMYQQVPYPADAYMAWAEYYRQASFPYAGAYGGPEAAQYGGAHAAYAQYAYAMPQYSHMHASSGSISGTEAVGRPAHPGSARADYQPGMHVPGSADAPGYYPGPTYPAPMARDDGAGWSAAYNPARSASHGDLYADAHHGAYSPQTSGADARHRSP